MTVFRALPEVWPGAVLGAEIGILGLAGKMDIGDSYADLVRASAGAQGRCRAAITAEGLRNSPLTMTLELSPKRCELMDLHTIPVERMRGREA